MPVWFTARLSPLLMTGRSIGASRQGGWQRWSRVRDLTYSRTKTHIHTCAYNCVAKLRMLGMGRSFYQPSDYDAKSNVNQRPKPSHYYHWKTSTFLSVTHWSPVCLCGIFSKTIKHASSFSSASHLLLWRNSFVSLGTSGLQKAGVVPTKNGSKKEIKVLLLRFIFCSLKVGQRYLVSCLVMRCSAHNFLLSFSAFS